MADRFSQDNWYAVCGVSSLRPGDVIPVHLFGNERVAWRGADGNSHIWQNRCIHRGMRLQYGFVDGDRLACRYHGWRFAAGGKCALIPAHPDMTPPEDYCVPSHPSVEAGGLLWTTTGAPDDAPPDLSEMGTVEFCRTITIDAPPALVAAAADEIEFPPFGNQSGDTEYSRKQIASGLISIEASWADGSETLLIATQPVSRDKTQLHVLAAAAAQGDDKATLRRHYARWAQRFRGRVENAAIEGKSE